MSDLGIPRFSGTIGGADSSNESTLDSIVYVLTKPIEILTKAVGSLVSDDPQFTQPSTGVYDQPDFSSLFREAGIGGRGDAVGNVAAAGLGIGAAILLDPLQAVASVGSATRVSRALKLLGATEKGANVLGKVKLVDKALIDAKGALGALDSIGKLRFTEGVRQIPKASSLRETAKKLLTRGFDKTAIRKELAVQGERIDAINSFLKTLRPEQLERGKTLYERIQRGQQVLFGFNPSNNLLLRKALRSPLSESLGGKIFSIPALDKLGARALAPVIFATEKLAKPAGIATKVFLSKILNGFNADIPVTDVLRKVKGTLLRLERDKSNLSSGISDINLRSTAKLLQQFKGISPEERLKSFLSIADFIELNEAELVGKRLIEQTVESNSADLARLMGEAYDAPIDEFTRSIKRVNLTPVQKRYLKPTKVSTKGIVQDLNKSGRFSAYKQGNSEVRYSSDKLVFSIPGDTAAGFNDAIKLSNSIKVPGLGHISVVEDGNRAHLVSPNLIDVPTDTVNLRHIQTLENIMSMLSKRKIALVDIADGGAFRFGADGSVQLIDPRKLRRVKSTRAALALNQDNLRSMASNFSLQPIEFKRLRPGKFSKVSKNSFTFVDSEVDTRLLKADPGAKIIPVNYFDDVANFTPDIPIEELDDAARGEFDAAVQDLLERQAAKPIVFGVDDLGKVHIYDGRETLRAARLLGVEHIPTIHVGYIGNITENIDDATRVVRAANESLADVVNKIPSPYSSLNAEDALPDNIRIIEDSKFPVNSPSDLHNLQGFNVRQKIADLLSRKNSETPVGRSLSAGHHGQFIDVMNRFVDTPAKEIDLLERLAGSGDIHMLEQALESMGVPIRAARLGADDIQLLNAEFTALRRNAVSILEDLNSKGIFTERTINGIDKYTLTAGGKKTVAQLTPDGLVFTNRGMTRAELADQIKDFIEQSSGGIDRSARIEIRASDGISRATGREILTDARSSILGQRRASGGVFFAAPDQIERLKSIGVFRNEDIRGKIAGSGRHGSLARSIKTKPKTKVGFVTVNGDLLLSINHDNVESLMADVFGQANRAHREVVIVEPKGIHISNLLGQNSIGRVTTKNLEVLERRMKNIAHRLSDAGFGDDIPVIFHTPLEGIWNKLYGVSETSSGRPLRDILSRDFHLNVTDDIKNLDLSLYDSSSIVSATERHLKAPEGPIRDAVKYAIDKFDDAYVQRVEAGIPTKYIEGYYARILNPRIQREMDDAFREFVHSNKKLTDRWNVKFKQRSLTDLTTSEIQQMWKDLRVTPQDFIQFGKNTDHPFLKTWATFDVDLQEVFVLNPFLSAEAAELKAAKDIAKVKAFREITRDAALTPPEGLTLSQIRRWANSNTELAQLDDLEKEAVGRVSEAENLLESGSVDIDTKLIEQELASAQKELDSITKKKIKLFNLRGKVKIQTTGDENVLKEVAINRDDALRLIDEKVLDPQLIRSSLGAPVVHIPFEAVKDQTNFEKIRYHIFPAQVRSTIDRFYKAVGDDAEGFLKLWDSSNSIFKSLTLFSPPAVVPYTMRNIFSNFILGAVGGVNIDSYGVAIPILNRVRSSFRSGESIEAGFRDLKSIAVQTPTGPLFGDEIWSNFVRGGGLSGSLHFNEFGLNGATIRKMVELGIEPSSSMLRTNFISDSKLIKKSASFAQAAENFSRFTAYIDALRKGGTFEDAALNVKKLFYNYNELSLLEQRTLRRFIPFYSWLRFNTPRMISTIATNPLFHLRLLQAKRDIEQGAGGPASDEELADWLNTVLPVTVGRKDGKVQVLGMANLIPMADAYKAVTPKGFFSMIGGGLSPLLKVPAEVLLNKSTFTGSAITKVPGGGLKTLFTPEPARSQSLSALGFNRTFEHILNSTLRSGSMIAKGFDALLGNTNIRNENPDLYSALLDLFLVRAYESDVNTARDEITFRQKELKGIAKFFIRLGRKTGRKDYDQVGRRLLLGVNLEAR